MVGRRCEQTLSVDDWRAIDTMRSAVRVFLQVSSYTHGFKPNVQLAYAALILSSENSLSAQAGPPRTRIVWPSLSNHVGDRMVISGDLLSINLFTLGEEL